MELVSDQDNKFIFVDYSHTPDSLAKALQTVKEIGRQKVILVFGCGGDRDKQKRPLMGDIAAKYADIVIVTDDNPRTENSHQIRQEILDACPNGIEIADRRQAIKYAINSLREGDTLLIAGKGHEDYQIIGDNKYHFDDRLIAIECVKEQNKNDI
jgi:UDP-N-acetylmuramoyl-L-alanyl-D-glutamate--2,6-diaminopimelate ligase